MEKEYIIIFVIKLMSFEHSSILKYNKEILETKK